MTDTIQTTAPGIEARVGELLDAVIVDTAVFPVEIVVRGRTGSRVVEVYVDSEEPIGSDDLAAINRDLGAALDAEDLIRGAWRLNVSTPGADRPLLNPRQFRKHVGRTLDVRWVPADTAEERTDSGTLVAVEADGFVIGAAKGGHRHIPFDSLVEAKVQLPW